MPTPTSDPPDPQAAQDNAPTKRVILHDAGLVEYTFAGTLRVGKLPSTVTRMAFQSARDDAFGWSLDDLKAARDENKMAREDGRKPKVILKSLSIDRTALSCVYAAAVGECWPDTPGMPKLAEYRHDVSAFGAAFVDWALYRPGHKGRATAVLTDLREVGRELVEVMIDDLTGLFAGAQKAAGFTGPKDGGTGST